MNKVVLTLAILVHTGVLAAHHWHLLTPQATAQAVEVLELAQLNDVEDPAPTEALIEEEETPIEEDFTEPEVTEALEEEVLYEEQAPEEEIVSLEVLHPETDTDAELDDELDVLDESEEVFIETLLEEELELELA